jgi:hypothetical protein
MNTYNIQCLNIITETNKTHNTFVSNLLHIIHQKHFNNEEHRIPNMIFYGDSIHEIYCIIRSICSILNTPVHAYNCNKIQSMNSCNSQEKIHYNIKIDENNKNILLVNCIFNSSIIHIRTVVQHFIKSKHNSKYGHKVIIFNNMDDLSEEAQCALRVLMEENSTNLFIGIASNINNIVMPILSRMMSVYVDENLAITNNKDVFDNSAQNKVRWHLYSNSFYALKYNKYTHWLYVPTERSIKIIMILFNTIVNELILYFNDISNLTNYFKELHHYYKIKHNTTGEFKIQQHSLQIHTYVNKCITEHIVLMNKCSS